MCNVWIRSDQTVYVMDMIFMLHYSLLCLSSGVLPQKHPEEHGVHMSQRQELHYQQGDEEPLSILSPAEVLYCGNVQRVWVLPSSHTHSKTLTHTLSRRHTLKHTRKHTNIRVHTKTCTRTHTHTHTNALTHRIPHTHTYSNTCTHLHTNAHTHTYSHIRTITYTHMHTNSFIESGQAVQTMRRARRPFSLC